MASLRDIAERAEVSLATASKVLNASPEMQRLSQGCIDRVQQAARELDYQPNYHSRVLMTGRSRMIGVPVSFLEEGHHVLLSPFHTSILSGAETIAKERGYGISLFGQEGRSNGVEVGRQQARQKRIDGLLLIGSAAYGLRDEYSQEQIDAIDVPFVLVGDNRGKSLPHVYIDDVAGIHSALDHLWTLGHRRICFAGAPSIGQYEQRLEAFRAGCAERGIQMDVLELNIPYELENYDFREARQRLTGLFAGEIGFTAMLCQNDQLAITAMISAYANGVTIPEHLSLVGFDDLYAPWSTPPLTTVSHELAEMGRRGMSLLIEMLESLDPLADHRREVILTPALIERESTAPPRQSTS